MPTPTTYIEVKRFYSPFSAPGESVVTGLARGTGSSLMSILVQLVADTEAGKVAACNEMKAVLPQDPDVANYKLLNITGRRIGNGYAHLTPTFSPDTTFIVFPQAQASVLADPFSITVTRFVNRAGGNQYAVEADDAKIGMNGSAVTVPSKVSCAFCYKRQTSSTPIAIGLPVDGFTAGSLQGFVSPYDGPVQFNGTDIKKVGDIFNYLHQFLYRADWREWYVGEDGKVGSVKPSGAPS